MVKKTPLQLKLARENRALTLQMIMAASFAPLVMLISCVWMSS